MSFKGYRDFAIVLLALAVPFWFLRASMKDPRQISGPDRVLVQVSTPVQYAAATLARGISSLWGDYVYLVDVKADNARLAAENARLAQRVAELEALETENRRLERLLDLQNGLAVDVVSAQVISRNTNEFFRVLRVTLDSPAAGIGPNLAVLAPDGVVGTTRKSAGDTIDVRLVVDAGAGVDVAVQRTGARGYVRGTGEEQAYSCNVEYMQRTDEVEVGDLLLTSGVGLRFPKGVPVCRVAKITKRDFGIYQQVTCTPTVDFSRLGEVLVVLEPRGAAPAATTPAAPTPPRKP